MSPSTISRGAIPGAQQYDLSAASKQYTVTAASLKTAANDQKTAADKTNTSAGTMNTAAQEMLVAARAWQAGAGLISSALSASNIHNLAVAGTKTSVARK
jgi:3-mercaptopyruvate sulfurtransferase SseA